MTFPFAGDATLRQQDNVFNRRADRDGAADFEDARHPATLHHPAIGISCDGRYVVGQKNSPVFGGSLEKRFVIDSSQPDILRTHYVDTWAIAAQCAEYIVVEILVGQPAQGYSWRRASRRARTPSGGQFDSFVRLVSAMVRCRCAK